MKKLYLAGSAAILILVFIFISQHSEACNITYQKGYLASGNSYQIETNSVSVTTPLNTNAIKFTSADPADIQFSGNNVAGVLSYSVGGVHYDINGIISRPDKNGNAHIAYYFVETTTLGGATETGVAYFLIVPGNEASFTDNTSYSTSSDPVDGGMNVILTEQTTNNTAPTITSDGGGETSTLSVEEGTTSVTTVTSTDPDESDTYNYYIDGGADASEFTIDESTGELSFVSAPDYTSPTDADGDNVYHVDVAVSDSYGAEDIQSMDVTITSPLPIELLIFEANYTDQRVKITWSTASENNNAYFEIEKSSDLKNWTTLCRITGAGTSSMVNEYQYYDYEMNTANCYYRLVQYDFDGNMTSYSAIHVSTAVQSIEVTTTPYELVLNNTGDYTENLYFQLINLQGQRVMQGKIDETSTIIGIDHLEKGVYILSVESNNQHFTQKVIIP
jgi:hypothetical protein